MNTSGTGTVNIVEFTEWVKPDDLSELSEEEKRSHADKNAWLLFRIDQDRNAKIDLEEVCVPAHHDNLFDYVLLRDLFETFMREIFSYIFPPPLSLHDLTNR